MTNPYRIPGPFRRWIRRKLRRPEFTPAEANWMITKGRTVLLLLGMDKGKTERG